MARGWESKAVEAQMDAADAQQEAAERTRLSAAKIEGQRMKKSLLLSRARVSHDLEASRNPRYQKVLADALADLDEKLAQLE